MRATSSARVGRMPATSYGTTPSWHAKSRRRSRRSSGLVCPLRLPRSPPRTHDRAASRWLPSRAASRPTRTRARASSSRSAAAWAASADAAHAAALRLLEARARTRLELEQRLEQRGFEARAVAAALDRLAEVGLVDDQAFARDLAEIRAAEGVDAPRIALDLRDRGVDPEMAVAVADETAPA